MTEGKHIQGLRRSHSRVGSHSICPQAPHGHEIYVARFYLQLMFGFRQTKRAFSKSNILLKVRAQWRLIAGFCEGVVSYSPSPRPVLYKRARLPTDLQTLFIVTSSKNSSASRPFKSYDPL